MDAGGAGSPIAGEAAFLASPLRDRPGLFAAFRVARAAFVAFHLTAVVLVALPSAGSAAMNRRAWATPTVQGEFRAWSARLRGLGLPIGPEALEAHAWTVAQGTEAVRRELLRPFRPYYTWCGTWQSWKMFVAPHRFPARLEIEIDRGDGAWEPIFVARSDTATWRRAWFDHDRMRAAVFRFGWDHFKRGRQELVDFVAAQVREDFPDAARVRVSFVRYRTPTPAETRAGVRPDEERALVNVRELR